MRASLLLIAAACGGTGGNDATLVRAGEGLREVLVQLVALHEQALREGRTAMQWEFSVPVRDGLLTGAFLYPNAPADAATGEASWWVFTDRADFVARGDAFLSFLAEGTESAGLGVWTTASGELRFDYTGGRLAPELDVSIPGILAESIAVRFALTSAGVGLAGFEPPTDP